MIIDQYDLVEDSTIRNVLCDNARKAACYKIDLVFDSYFNMPIRSQLEYNYFELI